MPGVKERGQAEASLAADGAARTAADLALDDERAQGAFGKVVVRRHGGVKDELIQLVNMAQ